MRLRVGVGLWTGQGSDYRDAVPLAVAAEEAGFDSFWVTEHHSLPDGYLPAPLTLLAALAPVTARIALGTGLVLAPLHHPLRLAEDAAVVDRLSGGRLVLGLGLGYAEHEYRAFGVDPARRGGRLEALVGALRTAWTGRPFCAPELGLYDVRVTPTPAHPVPIWLGGSSDKAFDRAARLGDGFIFFGGGTDHAVHAWDRVRDLVRAHGRPADRFGGEYVVLPWGEIGELTADIDAWQRAGGTHASIVTMGRGLDSVDGHIHLLSTLADALDRP